MSAAVVLDTTPLSLLIHPNATTQAQACRMWLNSLLAAGRRVVLPEIADYEIRRELIRLNSRRALNTLAGFVASLDYVSISTAAMRLAAELWAQARQAGRPTAPDHALHGDAILAAQALTLGAPAVVATSNPAHLTRYVAADLWSNIKP